MCVWWWGGGGENGITVDHKKYAMFNHKVFIKDILRFKS